MGWTLMILVPYLTLYNMANDASWYILALLFNLKGVYETIHHLFIYFVPFQIVEAV